MKIKPTYRFVFYIMIAFAAGLFLGIKIISYSYHLQQIPIKNCIQKNDGDIYINNSILCDNPETKNVAEFTDLKNKIMAYINSDATASNGKLVSVYFRDLNAGDWFGINESAQFSPASLLKVPMMIAYYKEAQSDPSVSSNVLVYDGSKDSNAQEVFKSVNDIKPGGYTVDNLIKSMIVNSDNNALDVLSANIDQDSLNEIYTDLGLSVKGNTVVNMTAKQYSEFFLALYNARYLNRAYSEKALAMLVNADFPDGLSQGLLTSRQIPIAQKFGERTQEYQDGTVQSRELHDCGIIYYPARPYLLCIMTQDSSTAANFQSLSNIIENISQIVYDDVSTQTISGKS